MRYRSYYFWVDCFRVLLYSIVLIVALVSLRPHLLHELSLLLVQSSGVILLVLVLVYLQRLRELNRSTEQRVVEGTKRVTPTAYLKQIKRIGIGIVPHTKRRQTQLLPIEAEDENKHFLLVGDTGSGKSAIIHSLLSQIRERVDESVLIYDPSLEFWRYHGSPETGDVLLAPELSLCPYWDIVAELRTLTDIHNLTESLIPNRDEARSTGDFWEGSARKVLAELLQELVQRHGSTEDLLNWLRDPKAIDRLLSKATAATTVSPDAKTQRAGVLASLALIERSLSYLPKRDGRPKFSFQEWVANKRSWVFLGARGIKNQDALRPLFSTWIEVASRELTTHSHHSVWFIVDEFPSLQRLSIIPKVLSQGRKSSMKILLSMQGKSQVEHRYGKEAEAMLSSPKTKVFLRNSHFDSATWCAKMIGMPIQQKQVESYSHQPMSGLIQDSMTYRFDRQESFLVVPNNIQNLDDREGYLRYRKWVVPFRFDYPTLSEKNLVPAVDSALDLLPVDPPPVKSSG